MHERKLAYPAEQRRTRRGARWAGAVRYALAWVAATTAAVLALSMALHRTGEPSALLASAIERASCRLDDAGRQPAARTGAALGGGKLVVRYRATLTVAEFTRLQRIARRLAGQAVTVPGAPAAAAAIEAIGATYRLDCPRVDEHTEEALILFALSVDGAR